MTRNFLRPLKYLIGFSFALIAVSNCFSVLSNSAFFLGAPSADVSRVEANKPDLRKPGSSPSISSGGSLFINPTLKPSTSSLATRFLRTSAVSPGSPVAPVLTATKTDNTSTPVNPGDTIMYTVVITNTGTADALLVNFTDTVDANTTLVGGTVNSSPIAFDDSYTASGNIPIAPAASVLANDIDPDTGTNTGLTVTQVQGSGANVGVATNTTAAGIGGVTGSVTLLANGTFTYEPPPGFAGSDTFTYQISDAAGKTGTGSVTIAISSMVWFIDNTSVAAFSRGTFSQPFKTIAAFNAINTGAAPNAQPGHHVVLRPAGGTYAEADGINLRDNQTLTGAPVAFNTVFTADANSTSAYTTFAASTGAAPSITTTAGNGVDLASGNAVRGLNVGNTPGFFGFNGTAVGSLTIGTVSKTGTGGAISVSTSGTFGSTVNFGTLESTSSASNNLNLVGVTGTLGVSSAGTGFTGSAAASAAINISGGSVSLTYAGNVTKATTGALLSVAAAHSGTLTFNTGTLSATSGTGLQFNDADGTYNFNGTTTLNGGDAGIDILSGSGGAFSFGTGTTITSPTGTAFNVASSPGSPTITYSGSITQTTSGQRVVNIDGTTSNTITFQTGAITGGANSTGININNANGNVSFSNGMTLGTSGARMANTAVTIAGGTGTYGLGAVSIFTTGAAQGILATSADGAITSASGTVDASGAAAINIAGPGGLTALTMSLTKVAATGGTSGIVLTNTSGSFTVTGNGADVTLGGNGTGGTITGMTGPGVNLSNVSNISFTSMLVQSGGDDGIRGLNVTGFTVNRASVLNNGDAVTERGLEMTNLLGTCSITNSLVTGNAEDNLYVKNGTGTLNLTTTATTYANTSATVGNDGIQFLGADVSGSNNANMTIHVTSCIFTNNRGDHFQATTDAVSAATQTIVFQNNDLNNTVGTNLGAGLTLNPGGTANVNFNISNNGTVGDPFTGAFSSAITINSSNNSTMSGTINNNIIGNAGVVDSGSFSGDGITVFANNTSDITIAITNNTIRQYSNLAGIDMHVRDGVGDTLHATITGNTISNPGTFASNGILAQAGSVAGDTGFLCADIGGAGALANSIAGSGANGGDDFRIRQRVSTTVRLPGYGGANNDNAAVVAFIQGRNTGVETGSATNNVAGGGGGFVGGAACNAAASPTSPDVELMVSSAQPVTDDQPASVENTGKDKLRTAPGEGPYDDNLHKLKQEELNWMVQAAIARWVETGISAEDLVRMQRATFEVADLPNGELAAIAGDHIKIDDTAAGYGWFYDQSPSEDSEFQVLVPGKELQTTDLSLARGRMDLFTAVMRELGQLYMQGKDRLPKGVRRNLSPVMEPTLSPGVRRLPLDQWRIAPPPSTVGKAKPSSDNSTRAEAKVATGSFAPHSSQPAVAQADSSTGNVFTVVPSGKIWDEARYAVFNPATDQRIPASAAMKIKDGNGASDYRATRGRRVGTLSPPPAGVNIGPFTLPPGKSVTIMFNVTVNAANTFPPGTTQVCNQGFVSATGIASFGTDDPDVVGTNQPTCTTLNVADVSVTKSAGASPVCSTSNITYTINYNNAGPANALAVVVSDVMPAGTILVSAPAPANWSRTDSVPVGGNGTLMFARTGASPTPDPATFTVTVSIDGTVTDGTVLSNTASVSSTTPDPNTANNTSSPATMVTVKKPPTTATVGGPQTICALGTTTGLGGNTPTIGTGTWSVQSGGTGTFSSTSDPNATFTHTSGTGPVVVRWTISNSPCPPSTADVTITITPAPTTATVGGPQTICALGTTTGLGGNTPVNGTGMWSVFSGGTGTFNPDATTPNATFTHTGGAGPVVVRWTISNGSCTPSTADVTITINQPPTTATVGGPQAICALGTTTGLGGNVPTSGTGMWTVQSGGTGTFNPGATTPNATFTHTSGAGPIVLRWTISHAPCPDSFAEVTITITPAPTTATVGGPQTICALGTTAGLGGNTPTSGTGMWSVQSGGTGSFNPDATTPNATFTHTGGSGPVVVRWTISNGSCTPSTADVSITINQPPTTATVGGPQAICALGTTTGLGGNAPTSGTGMWTVQSGGTGTFNPGATTPNATFTHTSGAGPIVLRWTISHTPCPDSFAEVTITITPAPTTATVGGPQTICALGTTAGLGGNTPTSGTGMWSVQSGGTGTFNPNASTPNATFTHTGGAGPVVVRWTISNGSCTPSTADVTITITQPPTTATVGPNQTIPPGGTTAGLGGNTPTSGTGMWSIVTAGATGTFNPNASTPNATWTHVSGSGTVVLRWTISNPPCPSSTADVSIQIGVAPMITCPASPVMANATPGQCQAVVTFTVTATGTPPATVMCTPPSGSTFPVGNTTVNCTATNGVPPNAMCSFTVQVKDTEGPQITLTTGTIELWSPNHSYTTITMSQLVASVTDNCGGNLTNNVKITSVSSDEPENAPGNSDGNTVNDIVIAANCKSVQLRAERDENLNGRVYTINLKVTDGSGNSTTASRTVVVPLNQSGGGAILGPGPGYTKTSSCP